MSESINGFEPYQKEILRGLEGKILNHPDFVAPETYGQIFDAADLKAGDTVLDLGAGYIHVLEDHSYTHQLEDRGLVLIPVDDDVERLESWLLHPYHQRRENETVVRPVTADVTDTPFKDESVAFALSINLINAPIEKDTEEILVEAHRILKPTGQLIISSFGYDKMQKPDGTVVYNNGFTEDQFVTAEDVKRMAIEVGFAEVEDLPLDQARIDAEFKSVQEFLEKKGERLLEIVHPFAVLLKK